jgi:hypothetical protein
LGQQAIQQRRILTPKCRQQIAIDRYPATQPAVGRMLLAHPIDRPRRPWAEGPRIYPRDEQKEYRASPSHARLPRRMDARVKPWNCSKPGSDNGGQVRDRLDVQRGARESLHRRWCVLRDALCERS